MKTKLFLILSLLFFAGTFVHAQKYVATIATQDGHEYNCTTIDWDNCSYLEGKIGTTSVTIPFKKINKIVFAGKKSERYCLIKVYLKDQTNLTITLFDGFFDFKTNFGKGSVKTSDVKTVEFFISDKD